VLAVWTMSNAQKLIEARDKKKQEMERDSDLPTPNNAAANRR
jgi:hypothetical protein